VEALQASIQLGELTDSTGHDRQISDSRQRTEAANALSIASAPPVPLNHEFQIVNVKLLTTIFCTFQNLPSQILKYFPRHHPHLEPATAKPTRREKGNSRKSFDKFTVRRVAALRVSEFVTVRGVGTVSSCFLWGHRFVTLDLECGDFES
jgi:hypothetical protein